LPDALVQNSLLATNDHKHTKRNKNIIASNGLTKHNEKKNDQKKKSSNEMFNSNVDG